MLFNVAPSPLYVISFLRGRVATPTAHGGLVSLNATPGSRVCAPAGLRLGQSDICQPILPTEQDQPVQSNSPISRVPSIFFFSCTERAGNLSQSGLLGMGNPPQRLRGRPVTWSRLRRISGAKGKYLTLNVSSRLLHSREPTLL